jgi:hypothetical protein
MIMRAASISGWLEALESLGSVVRTQNGWSAVVFQECEEDAAVSLI